LLSSHEAKLLAAAMAKISVVAIQNGPQLPKIDSVSAARHNTRRTRDTHTHTHGREGNVQVGVVGDRVHEFVGEGDEAANDPGAHLGGVDVKVLGVVLDVPDAVRLALPVRSRQRRALRCVRWCVRRLRRRSAKTIRDEAESSTELDEGAMTLPPISLSRSV
jgi:hypothetical protein